MIGCAALRAGKTVAATVASAAVIGCRTGVIGATGTGVLGAGGTGVLGTSVTGVRATGVDAARRAGVVVARRGVASAVHGHTVGPAVRRAAAAAGEKDQCSGTEE